MKYLKFNVNHIIMVRLKEKGIEHIVNKHNEIMPLKYQTSFSEIRRKANEFGYHSFQLWDFIDIFGNLGMGSCDYFDTDIVFNSKDLNPFEFTGK